MNTWTPGPWEQRVLMVVANKGRDTIVHCGGQLHPVAPRCNEAVANARLIAAAPEMAEALRALEDKGLLNTLIGLDEGCKEDDEEPICTPIVTRIRAILAKLESGS